MTTRVAIAGVRPMLRRGEMRHENARLREPRQNKGRAGGCLVAAPSPFWLSRRPPREIWQRFRHRSGSATRGTAAAPPVSEHHHVSCAKRTSITAFRACVVNVPMERTFGHVASAATSSALATSTRGCAPLPFAIASPGLARPGS